jgi:hypothetical protein
LGLTEICDGVEGGSAVADAACRAGSLFFACWFGSDGGTAASACEGSLLRSTEICDADEGDTVAGAACGAGSLIFACWFGTDGGTAASASEGPLLGLTEIDGAGTAAGSALSATCCVLGRTIAQAITAEVSATAAKTAQRRKMIDAKLRSSPTGSL